MSTTSERRRTREAAARAAARRRPRDDAPTPAESRLDKVERPDGPWGAGVVLTLLSRREPPNRLFEEIARSHGPVTHYKMAGEHVYLLSDPELINEVFLTRARDVMKGRGLQAARPLLGNGLLTSEGEFHLRQRRLSQPAFHKQRIAAYADQMVAEALRHQQSWAEGAQVEMVQEMTSLTFAIVGRTLFGTDLTGDAQTFGDTLEELMSGFGQLSAIGNERIVRALPKGRHLLSRVEDLDAVVQRIIDEHREKIAAGEATDDLLTWMIQARDGEGAATFGESMTDDQLRDEVMTMVLAGHETTAMALSWAWWLLSSHPTVADRMAQEAAELLRDASAPDGLRAPTFGDIASLPYTHAVVAETIRLYPPAWIMGRRTLTDLRLGEWDVPSGSIVLGSPWIMHRDPDLWPRATSFNPDRWLDAGDAYDESAPGQRRGAYIPFGFGNRRCIGEQFAWTEAILLLAALTPRWSPRLVPGSPVDTRAGVTLRPKNGLPMTLERRALP